MTPEQIALVADLREDAIAQHIIGTDESKLTAWRLDTSANLIEAQAAELATLRAERDAAVERASEAYAKGRDNAATAAHEAKPLTIAQLNAIGSLKGGA